MCVTGLTQNLPPPSLHVQFLIEMDRLQGLEGRILAYADTLEEDLLGVRLEIGGMWGRLGGMWRAAEIQEMRRGLARLFGCAYLPQWVAEERRWEREYRKRKARRDELRAAVLLVYYDRTRKPQERERTNEAREVGGWDSPINAETLDGRRPDAPGRECAP